MTEGRVAWVTGAAGGIGAAVAASLAAAGATVVASDLAEPEGLAAGVRFEPCDTTSAEDLARVATGCRRELGRLDVLVTCAAVLRSQPFFDITGDDWDRIVDVNLKGTFLAAQAAAREMVAGGRGGVIVTMGSVGSERARPGLVPYCASKGGIVSLTSALAVALAEHGIRVVGIVPGTVQTGLNAERWKEPGARAEAERGIPLGRLGQPDDIAAFATFLASDQASFASGAMFRIDGARTVSA